MVGANEGPCGSPAPLAQLVQEAWFHAASAGIFLVDRKGCCLFVNDRLPQMLGCSSAELLGKPLAPWICGGEREAALVALAGKANERRALEVELKPKEGEPIWVELELSSASEPDGTLVGTLGAAVDVTERRRAAASLPAIAEATRALASQMDGPGVARVVSRALGGGVVVGVAEAALVGLASPDKSIVTFHACSSVEPRVEAKLRPLLGLAIPLTPGSVAEEVLATGKPLVLGPEAVDRLLPAFAEVARQIELCTIVCVPLAAYGRPVGFMHVFRTGPGQPFDSNDVAMLCEIAERTALALERAYLFEEKQRAAARAQLLADEGAVLATALEVERAATGLANLLV
jgi:PAS domain S-box-containing protein